MNKTATETHNTAWRLLESYDNGNRNDVIDEIASMTPLAAAYVGALIGGIMQGRDADAHNGMRTHYTIWARCLAAGMERHDGS